jgi:hypothetical protein
MVEEQTLHMHRVFYFITVTIHITPNYTLVSYYFVDSYNESLTPVLIIKPLSLTTAHAMP